MSKHPLQDIGVYAPIGGVIIPAPDADLFESASLLLAPGVFSGIGRSGQSQCRTPASGAAPTSWPHGGERRVARRPLRRASCPVMELPIRSSSGPASEGSQLYQAFSASRSISPRFSSIRPMRSAIRCISACNSAVPDVATCRNSGGSAALRRVSEWRYLLTRCGVHGKRRRLTHGVGGGQCACGTQSRGARHRRRREISPFKPLRRLCPLGYPVRDPLRYSDHRSQ